MDTDVLFSGAAPHEQVVFCQDAESGLRAIIAIYSTALGPSLGGTRCFPYGSTAEALADVLNLSKAMAYKNALAGLDHGGGKAVIIGDPATVKTETLMRAYGRFVGSLNGRYLAACDVGTYPVDMDLAYRECRFITGRSPEFGGAGDSSLLTAYGLYQGMRACAEHAWGSPRLAGRRIGIAGAGKVGRNLVQHLEAEGAEVLITDISGAALAAVQDRHPHTRVIADTETLIGEDLDIYSPCALGGALDDVTVPALSARIVCGGANNQLAHPGVDKLLADRGILYAPDYLVNAGGVIQVADEWNQGNGGFNYERAKVRAGAIYENTKRVFAIADAEGVPPAVAADRLAERRMAEVSRLRALYLP
ncbi:MAG TPA: Glu/Leu/Phe/Val dehydrogenase dimerization domain-containing protein [Sporichthyaceae bacterium]|jgi:valine dehydrogenase (NAD+)